MASLDWSQCPAVESIPGKVSGAWVFKDTRLPISVVFENHEYGSSLEEIMENYRVTREQIQDVLEFAARSAAPPVPVGAVSMLDALLFDQSAPYKLSRYLKGHSVSTAEECGWDLLANGDLSFSATHLGNLFSCISLKLLPL